MASKGSTNSTPVRKPAHKVSHQEQFQTQFLGRQMHPVCKLCGDTFAPRRARAGYKVCLMCGEDAAREERRSWCVVQEYAKGNYQLITAETAATTLKQTNQKATRD